MSPRVQGKKKKIEPFDPLTWPEDLMDTIEIGLRLFATENIFNFKFEQDCREVATWIMECVNARLAKIGAGIELK